MNSNLRFPKLSLKLHIGCLTISVFIVLIMSFFPQAALSGMVCAGLGIFAYNFYILYNGFRYDGVRLRSIRLSDVFSSSGVGDPGISPPDSLDFLGGLDDIFGFIVAIILGIVLIIVFLMSFLNLIEVCGYLVYFVYIPIYGIFRVQLLSMALKTNECCGRVANSIKYSLIYSIIPVSVIFIIQVIITKI